jgi:hypothetical protein
MSSGVWAGAKRRPFASPETGLKGQPQERQHSAAPPFTAGWDAGPTAPGEGCEIFLREGS